MGIAGNLFMKWSIIQKTNRTRKHLEKQKQNSLEHMELARTTSYSTGVLSVIIIIIIIIIIIMMMMMMMMVTITMTMMMIT